MTGRAFHRLLRMAAALAVMAAAACAPVPAPATAPDAVIGAADFEASIARLEDVSALATQSLGLPTSEAA